MSIENISENSVSSEEISADTESAKTDFPEAGSSGKKTGPGMISISKYLIIAVMAAFIAFCVYTQNHGNIPFETVENAVTAAIDQETMRNAGKRGFTRFYGLNSASYDGVLMFQSVSGMSADEVLLVKVKDADQLSELTETINKRKEARINDFSGYAPEEARIMEEAELIVKGNYVLFLPYSGAADVKQAFLTALGD